MRRIEHEIYEGWIARDRRGNEIPEPGFRWRTRYVARCVVHETDLLEDIQGASQGAGGSMPQVSDRD